MSIAITEPTRLSIREPIPEIFETYYLLSAAADAHLNGDTAAATTLFAKADMPAVYNWAWTDWQRPSLNIRVPKPENDLTKLPKSDLDPVRAPTKTTRQAVLARDGYRCRYCGIPVIDADIRKKVHKLYPDAVPWVSSSPEKQHAAFSCFWLQYDHVIPHSHGGRSDEENVVICCALCNFGKLNYTLKQLDIADPRLRPPVPTRWDGLERLRGCA
jgi:5-methylcytosine-specific restriction endonuclease McrA